MDEGMCVFVVLEWVQHDAVEVESVWSTQADAERRHAEIGRNANVWKVRLHGGLAEELHLD